MLLSFVQLQVKLVNFYGVSKSSVMILNFRILQGNVATQLRWGGRQHNSYLESFLRNPTAKEFWKSVYICQSYDQKSNVFFETQRTRLAARVYRMQICRRPSVARQCQWSRSGQSASQSAAVRQVSWGTLVTWPLSITWRRDSDADHVDSTGHWSERGERRRRLDPPHTEQCYRPTPTDRVSAPSLTNAWPTDAAAAAAAACGSELQRHTQLTRSRVDVTSLRIKVRLL